jgi:hypothetical protein
MNRLDRHVVAVALVAVVVGGVLGFLLSTRSQATIGVVTSVSLAVHEHAPNYSNAPLVCGKVTDATEVFMTVSATGSGIAPQVELDVYPPNNTLAWTDRVEPAGVQVAGTHEYHWGTQVLSLPGRYTFEARVYDNAGVKEVSCDIYK